MYLKLYRIELIDKENPKASPQYVVHYAHSAVEAKYKCAKDLPEHYKIGKAKEVH